MDRFYEFEQKVKNNMERATNTLIRKWMFPPYGVIKINWDAMIDKTRKKMSVGVIARNHEKGIATICSSKPYMIDPTVAEAFAAWKIVPRNTKFYIGE